MAKVVLGELLGDVPLSPWIKFEVDHTKDPRANQFIFTITIEIEQHERVVFSRHKACSPMTTGAKVFTSLFHVPESVIREFRGQMSDLFTRWMHDTLLDNAFLLYESDPRIGWTWMGGNDLPRCPLLDPPEEFSRTGLGSSCAFCGASHVDPPIWAGANMMWLHSRCP